MKANPSLLLVAVVSVYACTDSLPLTSPNERLVPTMPQYQLAAAASGRTERGAEDDVLRLEQFLPGLGGVYVDGDKLVVFVPPGVSRVDALAKLALGATTLGLDPKSRAQLISGENVVLRPGNYPFSQLVAWSEQGAGGIVFLAGVVGIDANEGTNHLTIFVRDQNVVPKVFATARAAGLPEDAIETEASHLSFASGDLSQPYRPTGGGIEISNGADGNGSTCTIGYNVTIADDDKGFYTASHCATPHNFGAGVTGVDIWQPAPGVGTTPLIGSVAINPPWNSTSPNCAGIARCANVDAMFVRYYNPLFWKSQVPIMTQLATINYGGLYLGNIYGWWTNIDVYPSSFSYWEGMQVDKVGRTTGWTRGTIENTCMSYTADDESWGDSTQLARLLCQERVKGAYAGNGDSGAPVFIAHDQTLSQLKALGIVSAVDYSGGQALTGEGGLYCNTSNCRYMYTRLARIRLFVIEPY